jgi:hypothetical protein
MLKITPMPSLFGLIKDSYKMTTVGKVFIGATLAEAAYSLWQQNQPVAAKQQKKPSNVAEGISYVMGELDRFPLVKAKYVALNDAEKMYFLKMQLEGLGIKL